MVDQMLTMSFKPKISQGLYTSIADVKADFNYLEMELQNQLLQQFDIKSECQLAKSVSSQILYQAFLNVASDTSFKITKS